MLQVVEPEPQFRITLAKSLVPLAYGQQAGLLEAAGGGSGRRERVASLSPRHQLRHSLEVGAEQLPEDVGAREELRHHLKRGEADLRVLLCQVGQDQLVHSTNVGLRGSWESRRQDEVSLRGESRSLQLTCSASLAS